MALIALFVVACAVKVGQSLSRRLPFETAADDLAAAGAPVQTTSNGEGKEAAARGPGQFQLRDGGLPSGPGTSANLWQAGRSLAQLEGALSRADAGNQATAQALKRFASTGAMSELRAIQREDIVRLAGFLSGELSPGEAQAMLQGVLGMSPGTTATREDVKNSLVGIYDAVAGNVRTEVRPSVLTITDATGADGRITGQAHVVPAGVSRVYAVFENDFSLKGLDEVMTVWRKPGDDRMVFTRFEPIRQGSAYNYVWLEVEDGWPAGGYQVELFHPKAQSLLLASESFSVR